MSLIVEVDFRRWVAFYYHCHEHVKCINTLIKALGEIRVHTCFHSVILTNEEQYSLEKWSNEIEIFVDFFVVCFSSTD